MRRGDGDDRGEEYEADEFGRQDGDDVGDSVVEEGIFEVGFGVIPVKRFLKFADDGGSGGEGGSIPVKRGRVSGRYG
jgi:hypothetical protein